MNTRCILGNLSTGKAQQMPSREELNPRKRLQQRVDLDLSQIWNLQAHIQKVNPDTKSHVPPESQTQNSALDLE